MASTVTMTTGTYQINLLTMLSALITVANISLMPAGEFIGYENLILHRIMISILVLLVLYYRI
jgi:hypothetical protein